MRNGISCFIVILIVCFSLCFATCQNPILEKWWVDEEEGEEDFDYVAIVKNVPLLIYQTIVETKYIYETVYVDLPPEIKVVYVDRPVPPEVLLQHINIINIEFIIFAGESTEFNGDHGPGGTTDLSAQEKSTNTRIVGETAAYLAGKPDCFVILHGHANPVSGSQAEAAELVRISTARAAAAAAELESVYGSPLGENGEKRMTVNGYAGERSIATSNSSYSGLNRRVEVILFTVEADPASIPSRTGDK